MDHYHQTNPPTLLKSEVMGKQGTNKRKAAGAPICGDWTPGDKPDTPKGSATLMWVTMRNLDSGRIWVGIKTWNNAHVMPLADGCDEPPDCAVPHKPEPDGHCEDYEWTCWSDGHCDQCECEWVWKSRYVEIIAHAPIVRPDPFVPNAKDDSPPIGG